MGKLVTDPVRCYAGWHYPDRPQAVFREESWLAVLEVIKQWQDPQGYHFLVNCEKDFQLKLFFDIKEDTWQIQNA